ncbi:restriction endonuclease subunit S [Chryseobacterium manosquense]|uniref:Restriction endonuclease subunit S n=1 Tax=Chryseobacterium manosquense TaxID=2754694 RepID=A0A7H1DV96_9FLAO|nr:restriction endonuclease subunit S [Chryseobacterium manosquense]QNS40904.1 restriction endonuclease subunit S [Chryseobacterium manosquense]
MGRKKLEELLEFVIGGDWGKDENYEDENYDLAYCIRGSEIKNWNEEKGKTASLRKIKKQNIAKRNLIEGDILVEISGGGPEQPVGRTVLIDKATLSFQPQIPKICTNFLRLIRPNKNINSAYLNNYLTFFYKSGEIINYQGGSNNLRNLKFPDYQQLKIPIPPFSEQQAIVQKIEELFSELDKSIENLKTAQQQIKTYRQSVLKSAFEGKLTAKKEDENLMMVAEPNLEYGEKKLPEGWKWETLQNLIEVKDGTHNTPKYVEKGIPFITQKNIKTTGLNFEDVKYISQLDHDKFYKRSNVAKNDLIFSMIGANRGMVCIVDTSEIFSIKNVGLLKYSPTVLNPKYLLYFLKSHYALNYVKSLSKGGAQEFVGLKELRGFPIIYCHLLIQEEIVAEIESRFSVADKLEESINQSLLQAETLRQSILKKAFEGKLI